MSAFPFNSLSSVDVFYYIDINEGTRSKSIKFHLDRKFRLIWVERKGDETSLMFNMMKKMVLEHENSTARRRSLLITDEIQDTLIHYNFQHFFLRSVHKMKRHVSSMKIWIRYFDIVEQFSTRVQRLKRSWAISVNQMKFHFTSISIISAILDGVRVIYVMHIRIQ